MGRDKASMVVGGDGLTQARRAAAAARQQHGQRQRASPAAEQAHQRSVVPRGGSGRGGYSVGGAGDDRLNALALREMTDDSGGRTVSPGRIIIAVKPITGSTESPVSGFT